MYSRPFNLRLKNMHCLKIHKLGFEREGLFLFRELTLTACESEAWQVKGENGSGKTTFLRTLVGLLEKSEGDINWLENDEPCLLHQGLLYLGHESGVKLPLTAMENLRWYFALHGLKASSSESTSPASDVMKVKVKEGVDSQLLLNALEWAGLRGYEDTVCFDMSAGQRRRVALARLFVSQAPLWVLDEPFTAIDVKGVKRIEQRIEEHRRAGGIVLFTTHQASELRQVKVLNVEDFCPKIERFIDDEECA